jgi:hypothetical protein
MIGGIRKLDIPPVHLPTHITPPWEEPEITFRPDPPVVGEEGQICIQLANPLAVSKLVTVNFSVADFGAGLGFTPAASLTDITLPPHSLATYCASWTPSAGGTVHRCVLATLVQKGYQDQHSQRNVEVIHPLGNDLGSLSIPFFVGNPGLDEQKLSFDINPIGLNPAWTPVILTPGGDPYPATLAAGEKVALTLHFVLGPSGAPIKALYKQQPPTYYTFGSTTSIQVTELLGGNPEGGFTIILDPLNIYLPLIRR